MAEKKAYVFYLDWDKNGNAVWVPQTMEEFEAEMMFRKAVDAIPENKPEPVADHSDYIGKHEDATEIYDGIVAKLLSEKEIRAEKFRKTHGKNMKPADRKKNRMNRMHRLYGTMFEYGKDWYWERGRDGRKKSTEPDAEILRNLKDAELEKSAYSELLGDPEHYVGETTLQKKIDRKYAEMIECKEKFLHDHDAHSCGDYAVTNQFHFLLWYPDKYHELAEDLQKLQSEQKRRFRRKLEKGNEILKQLGW